MSEQRRIGVFVCCCGTNIAGYLDVPRLVEYAKTLPGVVFAKQNQYSCSDTGLTEIAEAIKTHQLDRVVVAACSPRTHEPLFRSICKEAGLNPYLFEMANIRDHCSWVHMQAGEPANIKAMDLIRMAVARANFLSPGESEKVGVHPSALVIGGGIAGMTAALNLAKSGFQVNLVERAPMLGGLLNQLYSLSPTGANPHQLIEKKIAQIKEHNNIKVFISSEVKSVSGFVGNFEVEIEDDNKNRFSISCGVIIVAIGARVFTPWGMFGYDGKKVITQFELEQKFYDATFAPSNVVMIQCVGARTEEKPYCSRICCNTAVKNALIIKDRNPFAQIYILYKDVQTYGVSNEELYRRARYHGIVFIKYPENSPPLVKNGEIIVEDELLGEKILFSPDYIVLSTPLIAHEDVEQFKQLLKVPVDDYGFFLEAHVKLRPAEFSTEGIYLCGAAHWPCDVHESIFQALGAASRASIPLMRGYVEVEPITSSVNPELCTACGLCVRVCPYKALEITVINGKRSARTITALCKGCGACGAGCPDKAITMRHYTDDQLFAQIHACSG